MSDKDENISETEQLNPAVTSEPDFDEYDEIISNMTYSDYLSAVYSYEEKAAKKAQYDRKILPLKRLRDLKKSELHALESSSENNRAERKKIHDDAVEEQKDKWQKTQDRLDVQIAQEVGMAKQQADA